MSCCPKQSFLRSCLPVRGGWGESWVTGRQTSAASVATLYWFAVVKCERETVDLQSIYIPTLTNDHELWIVIERMRLQTKATAVSLEIGRGAWSFGKGSEYSCCSSLLERASWRGSDVRSDVRTPSVCQECSTVRRPRGRPSTLDRFWLWAAWLCFYFSYFILESKWPRLVHH